MNSGTRLCSQCGFELPPSARFCAQCGARADDAKAASAPPLPAGERRQVAVLFADVAGYTRLSSTQDPERTHALLTRYFEVVDAAITQFGGTIDKHIGDAVMGVFGAPVAYGNDVERALRAAVAIHAAVAGLPRETGQTLGTHIGIACGEVIAAATGSSAHHSYTVTGDAVNLASRLTDLASAGETVVSDAVARAGASLAVTESFGCVTIRGLPGGIRAWKLAGLRAGPTGEQPLIDRDAERGRFAQLVARAAARRAGAVALLRADPGMGKSRLAAALLAEAQRAGARCHAATVLDFGAASGHDAIHALVSNVLDVPAADSEPARRSALDAAIRAGRASADDEPWLADLLLLGQRPGSLYDAMDEAARRSGKLRALERIVERAAAEHPCVLLFEDVHWASAWVLTCLRALSATAAHARVVLTMTTRRDGDPVGAAWPAAVTSFDIPPLARSDALTLARSHHAAAGDLAERCVARAQGNPLFLVQLLRSGAHDDAVPPTIQSVVLARLDRLAARDKSALQAAAVIGQRFPLDLLRHLVGDATYVPAEPVARDLLRGDDRGEAMLFTHALIRDGAYASLLHASRRELHLKAALWYERRDPALCAEHLERAEDPRAADAYLTAARAATVLMRTESALGLATRGLALANDDGVRYALAALVGEIEAELGHAAESIVAFEQALAAAQTERERCNAWIGIASGHRMQSAVPQGLAALDAANAHAAGADLVRERARIAYLRGNLHFTAGDAAACRRQHEQALDLARDAGDAECEAQALSGLADALYAQGRLRSAHAAFTRCLDICDARGYTRFALMNHCMVAIIDLYFGRVDGAIARLVHAKAIARDVRFRLAEAMCEEVAGWTLVFAGRPRDAMDWVLRGLPLARAIGAKRFEIVLLVCLARIRRSEGAIDEARTHVRDAWTLSEAIGARFAGPIVLGEMAALATAAEERARALADAERLLRGECLSHCYLGFYRTAIDVTLAAADWPSVERYAQALEDFVRDEPLPLIDFLVARGRALAAAGRGTPDREALAAVRERAVAWNMPAYRVAIDAALAASA